MASKSAARAAAFAKEQGIPVSYGNYAQMLDMEKPDAVYIATMPSTHAELTELCLHRRIPVLCEKAMFMDSAQARRVLNISQKTNTFAMEGMWSRFLPVQKKAKQWLDDGCIGDASVLQITIGCVYNPNTQTNLLQKEHGGGAAHHLTVYCHELATYYFGTDIVSTQVMAAPNAFGTDSMNQAVLCYRDKTALLFASCTAAVEERLVISGSKGRIVLAHPHYTNEALLYDSSGNLVQHFKDTDTVNGFVYEIR